MGPLYKWTVGGPWTNGPCDTQWAFKTTDNTLFIKFQGTCSTTDWKQNFMFWKRPYKRMKGVWFAHAGFVRKWKAVEDAVLDIIATAEVRSVVVSGFSQGAALAQLCHEAIAFHFPEKKCNCYAFGSPRVFGLIGFRHIRKRLVGIKLIERHHDLVCKVPLRLMLYRKTTRPMLVDKFCPISFRFIKTHLGYGSYV